jgi:preprotein translocase subunit SecA
LMQSDNVSDTIAGMRGEVVDDIVSRAIPEKAYPEDWDTHLLHEEALRILGLDLPTADWAKEEGIADEEIRERLNAAADKHMAEKAAHYGPEVIRMVEKSLLLQILDQTWKDHLLTLDHLRQGINLRAYAQRDPLNEYKSEAFTLFEKMLDQLRENVTQVLAHVELDFDSPDDLNLEPTAPGQLLESRTDPALGIDGQDESDDALLNQPATVRHATGEDIDPEDPATWGKVARNAPCPCASGRKYKHCHGKLS